MSERDGKDGSGTDGGEDEVDWLSSQFDPTQAVPKQPAAERPATDRPAPKQPTPRQPDSAPGWPTFADASPPEEPPKPVWPEWNAPPPEASEPSPPAASGGGGFSWNLRPSSAQPPAPEPVAPEPAAPEPAAPESAAPTEADPADVPTQAMPVPTQAMPIPPLVEPEPPAAAAPEPSAPEPSPPAERLSNADIPTQAIQRPPTPPEPWDPFATQDQPVADPDAAAGPPTEAYVVEPWMPAVPIAPLPTEVAPPQPAFPTVGQTPPPRDPTTALDSLFGESKFKEYDDAPLLGGVGGIGTPSIQPDQEFGARGERAPLTSGQRTLIGVAGALAAVLVLVLVFILGRGIGAASSATPTPQPSTSASSAPATTTGGLAAPGERSWNALNGGECIQPFSSAWAVSFTVVDCSADHNGQLISKGELPESAATPYPSTADLTTELTKICSDPKVLDYAQATKVKGMQLSFSFPPNSADWTGGDRTYYCFASLAAGGNLPTTLAVAKN